MRILILAALLLVGVAIVAAPAAHAGPVIPIKASADVYVNFGYGGGYGGGCGCNSYGGYYPAYGYGYAAPAYYAPTYYRPAYYQPVQYYYPRSYVSVGYGGYGGGYGNYGYRGWGGGGTRHYAGRRR